MTVEGHRVGEKCGNLNRINLANQFVFAVFLDQLYDTVVVRITDKYVVVDCEDTGGIGERTQLRINVLRVNDVCHRVGIRRCHLIAPVTVGVSVPVVIICHCR